MMSSDTERLKHSHVKRPVRITGQQFPVREDSSESFSARSGARCSRSRTQNVSENERVISLLAGATLAGLGLVKRDLTGLLVAGIGGALAYRGATGHCSVYESLGVDTSHSGNDEDFEEQGVHIVQSMLINDDSKRLYEYWRGFEKLPSFMTHLKSVKRLDEQRSRWIAEAPWLLGGQVSWVAEITDEHPNNMIAWETVPGSDIANRGRVTFTKAPGNRGTYVKVELTYEPPAGQLGNWIAKAMGDDPEQHIRSDLKRFKQLMETGEIATTEGQSQGSCQSNRC